MVQYKVDSLRQPLRRIERAWHLPFRDLARALASTYRRSTGTAQKGREAISGLLNVTEQSFYHPNENENGLIVDCFGGTFGVARECRIEGRRPL